MANLLMDQEAENYISSVYCRSLKIEKNAELFQS